MASVLDTPAIAALQPGTQILVNGDTLVRVPDEIVATFQQGDRLLVAGGAVLRVPRAQHDLTAAAVERAQDAFLRFGAVDDEPITRFYALFAGRLADDAVWSAITAANERDVARARARGRSTTRLLATERMRRAMIEGLRQWEQLPSRRGLVVGTIRHDGWTVDQVVDGLGVVGFIFEGRPNVFADATGVLRGGNTAVLRIGSDALGTAQAIAEHALRPALDEAGLPKGAVTLLESTDRAAGWALFSDTRLALAVARGSGPAVAQLGSIARQSGIPVSLHGTGGAWLIADETADAERFRLALYHSLDRKVCNTTNVVLVPASRAMDLVPLTIEALRARGEALGHGYKLHVTRSAEPCVPASLFTVTAPILRAEGLCQEAVAALLPDDQLGREWEWEATPEVSLAVVQDLREAVALFNAQSPRFIASLIGDDPAAHDWFFRAVDAPFVGDGFTRWIDGQYALNRPELGLSNWQSGRLFGRGGVLSGDSVFTVRLRARQHDPDLHR
ncbi:MAG TPA: aldehyde dehydrogenase family protein [Chloroflexota bacterium]|nr:aldehyde dehydrogenase family protein [Chloroflexota bacterium]